MKRLIYLFIGGTLLLGACNGRQQTAQVSAAQAENKTIKPCSEAGKPSSDCCSSKAKDQAIVTVYYFHGDRRCVTCKAVGEVSQQLIAEKYSGNGKVCFKDVNIDKEENQKLAEQFQVTGSSLYVSNGTTKENMTVFAFGNARTAPEKLQQKLTEVIEAQLN